MLAHLKTSPKYGENIRKKNAMQKMYRGLGKRKLKNLRDDNAMVMAPHTDRAKRGLGHPDEKGEPARKGEKKIEGGTVIVRKL